MALKRNLANLRQIYHCVFKITAFIPDSKMGGEVLCPICREFRSPRKTLFALQLCRVFILQPVHQRQCALQECDSGAPKRACRDGGVGLCREGNGRCITGAEGFIISHYNMTGRDVDFCQLDLFA